MYHCMVALGRFLVFVLFYLSEIFPLVPLQRITTCMQSTSRPTLLADSTSLEDLKDLKLKVAGLLCMKFNLPSLLGLDLMIELRVAYSAQIVQGSGNNLQAQATRCHGKTYQ
jgi:hypothetical protein